MKMDLVNTACEFPQIFGSLLKLVPVENLFFFVCQPSFFYYGTATASVADP
jgi:hypothetical protein